MRRGFTLVEVLVSVLIFGLIIAGIYGILNTGSMTYSSDTGLLELQQQARQGMEAMVRELREASNLVVTSVDEDDMITFDTLSGVGIQYYRDATQNQIVREYPSGTKRILANSIRSLNFSYNSPYIEIQLEAAKTVKQRELSLPLEAKIRLRNE